MHTDKLINALISIRAMAMDHPAFDGIAFKDRDFAAIDKQGGDIADWTMIAILADNALQSTPDADRTTPARES
jgi:hypothetical protein